MIFRMHSPDVNIQGWLQWEGPGLAIRDAVFPVGANFCTPFTQRAIQLVDEFLAKISEAHRYAPLLVQQVMPNSNATPLSIHFFSHMYLQR
ncbi:hypothetical protein AVEN_224707-1 [Araneus ventricosus]|uniref:Uncharacterized protein n=1 Tax=Araneus ventricosus TaxID=182803 RepID=A0A4Y2ESY1_ARAVE|nr:hypothetical protein AVEN_224707-1 [Araneus ventricosus]